MSCLLALVIPSGCRKVGSADGGAANGGGGTPTQSNPPSVDRPMISLHEAVVATNMSEIQRNLAWGADVNVRNAVEDTPLHIAARRSLYDITRYLLDHGADIEARGDHGRTPMHIAARNSDSEMAMLHESMVTNSTIMALLLLERGADVNARNVIGAAPLTTAAMLDRRDLATVLIDHGADANIAEHRTREAPGHKAAKYGHTYVLEYLLEHGAEIDRPGPGGMTMLHIAAQQGHTEIAALLIAHGADINARTDAGLTPLSYATENGQAAIVQLLATSGGHE
jgi:ankyrin repeat protein